MAQLAVREKEEENVITARKKDEPFQRNMAKNQKK